MGSEVVIINKKLYCINGTAGVGKDTFVSMVSSLVPTVNYSSVEKIKDVAKVLGWNGEKDERSRKFLSDLKILSTEYNDFPYGCIKKRIKEFYEDDIHEFMFIHIREPGDISRLVWDYPETKVILIENMNVQQVRSNMADAGVYSYGGYDIVIDNSGSLSDLKKEAEEFVKKYSEKDISEKE